MHATFNRFEIKLTKAQALSASHQGQCDADVQALLTVPAIRRQLAKIDDATLTEELKEYGAWDAAELENRADNEARIVWLAAGDICEGIK